MPPSAPPQAPTPTATADEAWKKFETTSGLADNDQAEAWFAMLKRLFPDTLPQNLSGAQYAKLIAELPNIVSSDIPTGDDIPF